MPLRRLRALVRHLSLSFVLLLALQPVLNGLPQAAASALASPDEQSQSAGDVSQPAQPALNQIVRSSLLAAGWTVSRLDSQLDEGSEQFSANLLSNSGHWHVEAQDEHGQTLTLDGTLNFTMLSEARVSKGFTVVESPGLSGLVSASCTVTGTLSGPGLEVTIDLATSLDNSDTPTLQNTIFNLRLLFNGHESTIKSTSHAERRLIAYNTTAQIVTSSLERDGKRLEATQTTTMHLFGHAESEVWLEFSSVDAVNQKTLLSIRQHLFQRIVGKTANQYMDRFDMSIPGNSYTLKEPGTANVTIGDPPNHNYVFVDKNGAELTLGGNGRVPGLSSVQFTNTNSSYNPANWLTSAGDNPPVNYSLAAPLTQGKGGSRRGGSSGRTPAQQAARL